MWEIKSSNDHRGRAIAMRKASKEGEVLVSYRATEGLRIVLKIGLGYDMPVVGSAFRFEIDSCVMEKLSKIYGQYCP